MPNNNNKFQCAGCGRTLLIGEFNAGTITVKCKKCKAVNLIQAHPNITIEVVEPAILVQGKVMNVILPTPKTEVQILNTK
jgi:LSD1 subclass zinc finger protein